MRVKVWFKYFIYAAAIILVQYLMPVSGNYGDFDGFMNFVKKNGIILYLIYITMGVLLGLEHFISELGRKGKWKVNLPKLLLMGIPALYICTCYYLMINTHMPLYKYRILIYPTYRFLSYSDIFIALFLVILGYVITTSFFRDNEKGGNRKIKAWLKYLVYSLVIIAMQYLGAIFFQRGYLIMNPVGVGGREHETNIEMLFFYGSLGLIIGTEYLLDMARKDLIFKINLPRILILGTVSLYFSLYSVLTHIDYELVQNMATYPIIYMWQRVCLLFVPVFQTILGFVIITSFCRYREEKLNKPLIENVSSGSELDKGSPEEFIQS